MTSSVKTGIYAVGAVFIWITANLGVAFYILAAAYLLDFALHYNQKLEFVQKATYYLGSSFFAYYLQNGQTFGSIPLLHALIVAMAAHEVLEVIAEGKLKLEAYKQNHPSQAAQITQIENVLDMASQAAPNAIANLDKQEVGDNP